MKLIMSVLTTLISFSLLVFGFYFIYRDSGESFGILSTVGFLLIGLAYSLNWFSGWFMGQSPDRSHGSSAKDHG